MDGHTRAGQDISHTVRQVRLNSPQPLGPNHLDSRIPAPYNSRQGVIRMDKELLEAIGQMMDSKLAAQRKDIMHDVVTLMDAEFKPRFNLLADGIQDIQEKLDRITPENDIEALEIRVDVLERVVKSIKRDIANLEKAN